MPELVCDLLPKGPSEKDWAIGFGNLLRVSVVMIPNMRLKSVQVLHSMPCRLSYLPPDHFIPTGGVNGVFSRTCLFVR